MPSIAAIIEFVCKINKKVMVKDCGYAPQEFGVYCATTEYIIYVYAMTIKLPREPGYGMVFRFFAQISLYEPTKMHRCQDIGMSVPLDIPSIYKYKRGTVSQLIAT